MPKPARGEIWRVDLGLTAKVRPCLVMSDYPAEDGIGADGHYPAHDCRAREPMGVSLPKAILEARHISPATNSTGIVA